ncbi:unnamed protein product, partial [Candidula unifasciata]
HCRLCNYTIFNTKTMYLCLKTIYTLYKLYTHMTTRHAPNYTTDEIIQCDNNNVTNGAHTSTTYKDSVVGETVNNDLLSRSYTANTRLDEGDTTDGINRSISTSTRTGQPSNDNFLSSRTFDVSEQEDGTITLQAVAEDRNQNKVVTVRTKKLRTPSNANEELRDTIVERKKLTPEGAVMVERDVIQTKNRLTSRGSNYYTRSAYTLRTRRENGGVQTVEHSVCVENENTSVSQGQSWGDKAEAQVTLVDASGAASVSQLPSSSTVVLPSACPEAMRDQHCSRLDIHPCKSREEQGNGVLDVTPTPRWRNESTIGQCQTLPAFEKRLSDVSVTEGHSTVFSCIVTGAVCVEWYHNGVLKRNSADFKQSYDGREARLQVAEVFLDDAGQYTCIAKNSFGEQSTACTLHVIACDQETVVVPMFLTKLTSRAVLEGEMLLLECDVIGSPEPTITWLKDGRHLGDSLTYSACYDGRVASLQISTMRFQDTGCYMCLAENPAGQVSIDAIITVQDKNQAPHFISKIENQSAVSGERIVLQCEITGTPLPVVLWKKDGRLLRTSSSCSQSFHNGVAKLELTHATPQDSGSYECVAKNQVSEMSCLCYVQVVSKQSTYVHNIKTSGSVKSLWTSPTTDQTVLREAITKSLSQEVVSDLRPSSPIAGYRPVLPAFTSSSDTEKLARSSSLKYLSHSGSNASLRYAETALIEHAGEKDRNYPTLSSSTSHSSSVSFTPSFITETVEPYNISASPSPAATYPPVPSPRLTEKPASPGISQLMPATSQSKAQSPSVTALRQHFLMNDQAVTTSVSNSSVRNTSVGVRRWDSLPPQTSKPIVFQRKSTVPASRLPIMPSYDTISDEEELHKLMNATEDFEERKKIRARIREIREKQREEMEAKRKQREAEAEDLVKKKFERAEEEKRKKMEAYKQQAPTHERDSKYHDVSQKMIQEKY